MIFDASSGKLLLIAGPCSLEGEALAFEVARAVQKLAQKYAQDIAVVFKGSFDKANRTSISSPRGTGLEEGMRIFSKVKAELGLRTLTDVHESCQCAAVGDVCDVLQIPAFLCRQTDLLVAAAKTGRAVNVKKGQFLSPQEMGFVVSKLRQANAAEIWQTDRGTFFGYQNLVVDMRSFSIMKEFGTPAILDATHSVQLPGAGNGVSGGERKYVGLLAKAAIAAGAQGLFIETHPQPEKAMSDSATQLPLSELESLIITCLKVRDAVK